MPVVDEADAVLNIVFTPGTFRYLSPFTSSLIDHSRARFRLVANGCGTDEHRAMSEFAGRSGGRVVEVFGLPFDTTVGHGVALDAVYAARNDGAVFAFADSDVKAKAPFLTDLLDHLDDWGVVTTGTVVWRDDHVMPADTHGVAGEHVFGPDGFVYGSPYVAMYRRDAIDRVHERWGVGFRGYADSKLPAAAREQLDAIGRRFLLYDTAKVLNILVQSEGHRVGHVEHPALVHVGGMSEYLLSEQQAPPGRFRATYPQLAQRWDFARFATMTLRALVDGDAPLPAAPELDPSTADRWRLVVRELESLVEAYPPEAGVSEGG